LYIESYIINITKEALEKSWSQVHDMSSKL